MRRPAFQCISDVKMTMSYQEASGESRIDKMRKFLSSPLTRKKPNGTHTKTFGTPLDILVQRSPSEVPIPFIVTRICQYIEHGGLMHEGLFRISGNARLIERLKMCFDQTGDAPLENEGDVPSAAALLKLFFRELPEPIIPLSMHQQFLNSVKGSDREESVAELACLVEKLPLANFSVLKYLSFFLTSVCNFEEHNRMSASSLGIVFGPNLFRVTEDFVGLKEQSLTNQIVTYFITDYYAIFRDEPPKYYKKSLSTSLEVHAKQGQLTMSSTDSMVASWPKLSAFPSLASTLNLRPLSVSIPTMDGSYYPLGSYAEPLDDKEHILMVDELVPEENLTSNDQTPDQSDKEETKELSSSMRRKRKERKIVVDDVDVSGSYNTHEESVPSESGRHWKDFYFIDDTDESFDQATSNVSDFRNSHKEFIDHADASEKVSFFTKCEVTTSLGHSREMKYEESSNAQLSHSPHEKAVNNIQSASCQRTLAVTSPDIEEHNVGDVLDKDISDQSPEAHSPCSLQRDVECVEDEPNLIVEESKSEAPEFSTDDRPAREKRFGRNHKRYQRSGGHKSYYLKKQFLSSEAKKPVPPVTESLLEPKTPLGEEDSSFQLTVECDFPNAHPPTDLAVTCDAFIRNNGSSTDQRHSWPILKNFEGEEMEQISPAHQFLRLSGNCEAPLSPSAYRSYLSHRSPHLDPNLPPSPPVEQEDLAIGPMDDVNKTAAKLLSKKIQSLKKKIKRFEENFETSHSYRPSQAEKCQYPEVKKLIADLTQARQDLKLLKEDQSSAIDIVSQKQWTPSQDSLLVPTEKHHKSTNTFRHSSNQGFILRENASVTIEESLQEALDYLSEKRKANQRPESLEDMSKEQLTEEKLNIQKLLLQFESIHGRPSSKGQRDLMRPLYDRYRSAKRILGKSVSFGSTSKIKDAMELQPILEHETMDFRSLTAKVPPLEFEDGEEVIDNGNIIEENQNEFDNDIHSDPDVARSSRRSIEFDNEPKLVEIIKSNIHANLHELSLPELFEQQQQARAEKRKLRRILREFEIEFQKENGRKVQRDDKVEMESVYSAYKHVRARLKLLEALATKHGHRK